MSATQADRLAIEIPKRLRSRPRDVRGYPIPFTVLIDKSGTPQFTINDDRRVSECRTRKLCALCGRRFEDGVWFIGGSRCFMLEHGAFVDPPAHYECAQYALRVCPFLAAPSYAKRIDDRKLRPGDTPDGMGVAGIAYMPPAQPERFGLGMAEPGCVFLIGTAHQGQLYNVTRWRYVEWWRNGVPVNAPDTAPDEQPMVLM